MPAEIGAEKPNIRRWAVAGGRGTERNGERRTAQEPVTEQRRVGKRLMRRRVAAFSVDAPLKGEHEIQRREIE